MSFWWNFNFRWREIWGSRASLYLMRNSCSEASKPMRMTLKNSPKREHSSRALLVASLYAILRLLMLACLAQVLYLLTVWGSAGPPTCGGLMISVLGTTLDSRHCLRKKAQAHALSFFLMFLTTEFVSFLCCCDALSSDVSRVLSSERTIAVAAVELRQVAASCGHEPRAWWCP